MFLKKNNLIFQLILIFFFLKNAGYAEEISKEKLIDYLGGLSYFSTSFIQEDSQEISEGKIFIGKKRIRVEYETPSKILLILDKDKAMYYNYDLDEDEFFNPNDTSAWFFSDIFNNPGEFFNTNSKITSKNNYVILEKKIVSDLESYKIAVYFENKPLLLRKIKLNYNDNNLNISLFNHSYNENFDKDFFKLINPTFF